MFYVISYPTADMANKPYEIPVTKTWNDDHHNGMGSLINFKGFFYCSFRQGSDHYGGKDGVVRIVRSKEGLKWESVTVLKKEGYDLRDPHLSVTPEGKIMVIMGCSVYKNRKLRSRLSHVSFLNSSGNKFSYPQAINVPGEIKTGMDWLWRVTWHDKTGYGVVYRLPRKISLVKTEDGINYILIKDFDQVGDDPNEATVRIMPDGEMFMMVRRESGGGLWGRSKHPYSVWTWVDMGMQLGGPDFVALNEDLFLAGTRMYDQQGPYTGLFIISTVILDLLLVKIEYIFPIIHPMRVILTCILLKFLCH